MLGGLDSKASQYLANEKKTNAANKKKHNFGLVPRPSHLLTNVAVCGQDSLLSLGKLGELFSDKVEKV